MPPIAFEVLKARRLTAIIQELMDRRNIPQDLRFLGRTAIVPATDGEILAKWSGYVQIADLVADDAQALTYASGKLSYETTNVPNLKHGTNFTQEQLNQLQALSEAGIQRDEAMVLDWLDRTIDGLLLGVRWRMEALLVAMSIDSLVYDRFGLKLSGTFGMPQDLKVTVAVDWSDSANATPVTDIWAVRLTGRTRYGQEYDRMTMSTPAFMAMVATEEFQTKAALFLPQTITFENLNLADLEAMRRIAQNVLGIPTIELYDARYWSQSPTGVLTSAPFLPIDQVVLSFTGDDNDPGARDFANVVVTESIVDSLTGGSIIGGLTPQRGPIAYVIPRQDLNPPTLTMWGVARGFPRKHRRTETAVLSVGDLTDAIPATAPF